MLFAIATKMKYRYPFKGMISTEDLWDLSVESLDTIYKELKNQLFKLTDVGGLIDTNENTEAIMNLKNKMQIVEEIFNEKKAAAKHREEALIKAAKRRQIEELLIEKDEQAMKDMTKEELLEALKALE